jgi:hypothetical protein
MSDQQTYDSFIGKVTAVGIALAVGAGAAILHYEAHTGNLQSEIQRRDAAIAALENQVRDLEQQQKGMLMNRGQ